MRYKVVCVRDRAADTYSIPQFVPALGSAIRSFGDEANRQDPNNPLYNHPEDFDLYELGEYDDQNGIFYQSPDSVRQIAIGKDLKRS